MENINKVVGNMGYNSEIKRNLEKLQVEINDLWRSL